MLTKLRKGAASVGVAGVLAVSIGLGQAAPAQALLPVLPAVAGAVGATGAGAAVSGWAIAGYAALTAGVLSASLAIQENSSVWFEDLTNWLTPEEVPAGKMEKNESFDRNPANGNPYSSTEGGYMWTDSRLTVSGEVWSKTTVTTATGSRSVNTVTFQLKYAYNTIQDGSLSPMFVMENQCKRFSDGVMYSEKRYVQEGQVQSSAGNNISTHTKGCLPSGSTAVGELMSTHVRAVSELEKQTKFPSTTYTNLPYAQFVFAKQDLVAKAPGYNYADPGYRATVQCKGADGSFVSLSLDTGFSAEGKVGIPSCKAAGLSEFGSSLSVDFLDGDTRVRPVYRTLPQADEMLKCDVAFGNDCKLEIYIDGIPCVVGTVQCAGWVSQHLANPARVKCYYAGREVAISNCGVLEGAYVYGGSPYTKNNTDGDPNTWDDPRKVPGWTPKVGPGGEPATNPDPTVDPNTQPNPNTQPSTGTDPGTDPGTSTGGFPTTGSNPAQSANCSAPSWSWNPVDWVFSPVMCALKEAFVPKQDVTARINELKDLSMTKAPLSWMNPTMTGPGGGGCPNWVVSVPGFSKNVVCESSFTAAILGARAPLFGLVAGAMVWPLFRSLWYAAIPILRVTPASSK